MKNPVLEQVLVAFHVVLYFWNVKIFFAVKIQVLLHPKTNYIRNIFVIVARAL